MRKNLFGILAIGFLISLSACGGGGSFESNVRKSAKYRCQEEQLMKKADTDEKAKKDLDALRKEVEEFDTKMRDKYKDKATDAMRDKAEKIMAEEMAKCK